MARNLKSHYDHVCMNKYDNSEHYLKALESAEQFRMS
jgi:hypothetical protein